MADAFQLLFGERAQAAEATFYDHITSLEVEENADLPGAMQLTLPIATHGAAGSEDLTVVGDDRFKPYARIAVVATPDGGSSACIFDGYVLSHRIHVDRGTTAASVRVWGQDVSCLMNLDEVVKPWTKSDGNVANDIFESYGFAKAAGNTQDDSADHPESGHTLMQRGTDAQFLRDRARRNGKLFRVCCSDTPGSNTGYFVKPKLDESPAATLSLNPPIRVEGDRGSARASHGTVDALDFEWDVARPTQVLASVLLSTKDAVDGGTAESGLPLLDSRSLAAYAGGSSRVMKARLTTTADSAAELRQRAASLLREAGWFVKCEGETDLARLGVVLRVGSVVQVDSAGRMHSGKYFVWSVRHTITAESHRMKFVLVRNAVGSP